MAKKKGSPRTSQPAHQAGGAGAHKRAEKRRVTLLSGFATWVSAESPSAPVESIESDLELLLDLKADRLDSLDPTIWTEDLTQQLLLDVVPRKVAMPRTDAMTLVPSLGIFFDYLSETGRWNSRSMSPTEAETLLGELEIEFVEAMDDPSRRGISGNVLTYAIEHGIDLTDQDVVERYMAWYNGLPHAERIELSDTGRLENPSTPFDPSMPASAHPTPDLSAAGTGAQDPGAGVQDGPPVAEPEWPWFLGDPPGDLDEAPEPARLQSEYENSQFARRARVLLELIGDGRTLTQTDALNRADTAEALGRIGVERRFRSMWDVPEIVGPWAALVNGGWIRLEGRKAVAGEGLAPHASPAFAPEAYADFAHALLASLLMSLLAQEPEEGGFASTTDFIPALLKATEPGGLDLPDPSVDAGPAHAAPTAPVDRFTGRPDIEELKRVWSTSSDLRTLADYGVIHYDGERYYSPMVVLRALDAATRALGEGSAEAE